MCEYLKASDKEPCEMSDLSESTTDSNKSDKSEVDREYMDNVAMKQYAKLLHRLM